MAMQQSVNLNDVTSISKFIEMFPKSYSELSRQHHEMINYGGYQMLGSSNPSDIADWLSANTGVRFDIAKLFIKLIRNR